MQDTPKANRLHIAILGRRNAGKSSLINALTKQDIALVSDIAGTTTDPVYKAMEILPIGPVMMIDTAGLDDEGQLGLLRIEKTKKILDKTDLVIWVIDSNVSCNAFDKSVIEEIQQRTIAIIGVINKIDSCASVEQVKLEWQSFLKIDWILVSTKNGTGIEKLKKKIIENAPVDWEEPSIIGDLIEPKDHVVLVVPIDSAAPKGRLILPQVQMIRDIIDQNAVCSVVKETELTEHFNRFKEKPSMVITDSQIFGQVAKKTPEDIPLTSFSVLFARYKGNLETYLQGIQAIHRLKPSDKILIAEGCTHHRQQDDIGTMKIPKWLNQFVGFPLQYEWCAGGAFPDQLNQYRCIVHCGACMLNRREVLYRLNTAVEADVAIVNYGILIAYLHGILPRALAMFPNLNNYLSDD